MGYFILEPEVAGSIGSASILDRSVHPPRVERLEYVFDGWLGDPLLESFPAFIITTDLRDQLIGEGLSGLEFTDVLISKGDQFEEVAANPTLPTFVRLLPCGKAGQDDVGTASDGRLIVSQATLDVLNKAGLRQALVESYDPRA